MIDRPRIGYRVGMTSLFLQMTQPREGQMVAWWFEGVAD